jgi:hypothetical protein
MSASVLIVLSFLGILSPGHEFQTLPLPRLLLCSSPCPFSAFVFTSSWVSDTSLAITAALFITPSFLDILSPEREFQTLSFPSLLLYSSPCSFVGIPFHQNVGSRRFLCHLCCSAHHPVRRRHSFRRLWVSDASLAISAALLITLSFLSILSPDREFQMLSFPSLLLYSSPYSFVGIPFQQGVGFRRFPWHVCCFAHHPVLLRHSFPILWVSDASLAISAALLITLSILGIISPDREFQTLPLPSLLVCSSPCPSPAFTRTWVPDASFTISAAVLITPSLLDILLSAREFQMLPLPCLLLPSSPCACSTFFH